MKRILLSGLLLITFWLNANAFKVFIFTDMEGCSLITNREQMTSSEGGLRMAQDMNACISGCFKAGATEVIVRDGHSSGNNVEADKVDKRARLIQGATPGERYKDVAGAEAIILLGYHGMAQTPNAIAGHSYSSASIQMMYLNGVPVGEIGIDAAIAAEHRIPVVMVSGDDKTCKEARMWIPGVVTCQVKKGTSTESGECLSLEKSTALIEKCTIKALKRRKSIPILKVNYPATVRWDYIPEGSLRVYDPQFKPFPNPQFKELTSDNIEELIVGKKP